jgi:hypothetical protein
LAGRGGHPASRQQAAHHVVRRRGPGPSRVSLCGGPRAGPAPHRRPPAHAHAGGAEARHRPVCALQRRAGVWSRWRLPRALVANCAPCAAFSSAAAPLRRSLAAQVQALQHVVGGGTLGGDWARIGHGAFEALEAACSAAYGVYAVKKQVSGHWGRGGGCTASSRPHVAPQASGGESVAPACSQVACHHLSISFGSAALVA